MKSYIKIKNHSFPESIPSIRNLDDQEWKEHIFSYLLSYYKEIDNIEIQKLIESEGKKERSEIEGVIKKHIKKWFRKNIIFKRKGFLLDREPLSEGESEGYYDLKFQHSYWNNTESYFAFECKNLGETEKVKLSKTIHEYVYVKEKEDSGMYRFFINKYSPNINFGGMIGFVVGKVKGSIVDKLVDEIHKVYDENTIGQLTKEKVIRNSIFQNSNSFDTIHIRKNKTFRLHHIIMDFYTEASC